jgi:hypothetical protein
MNSDITIPPLFIGGTLSKQIERHNARVELIWITKGSNAKPFTPSTVPAAATVQSRVVVVAEHSGAALEVRA